MEAPPIVQVDLFDNSKGQDEQAFPMQGGMIGKKITKR